MTNTLAPRSVRAAAGRPRAWAEYAALAVLLLLTALGYLWNLGASGWANSFYSAAAQAGSQSWTAFFFGSSDAANSITVDKPPASLWLMALSVRIFGLSGWSILLPQALLGVASVALLWASVRRYFGAVAGLMAGAVLAISPVAVLMFRYNNPEALLVLLMIAATWTLLRAVEDGRTRWLVVTGVLVGFGFLTKQLQVMLVLPPLALTYLVAGPPRLLHRAGQLLAAGLAMTVAAGWWLLLVEWWPARSRPWIGGSQQNSILELTMGYNGLGRLNGNDLGSAGGPGYGVAARPRMWGEAGIVRLFEAAQAGQIAWLLPAALVLAVMGIVLRGKAPRTDLQRAALALWLSWLVTTALVFSYMQGIFHAYYTVALAPAVAACAAAGFTLAWRERNRLWVRAGLALTVVLTAVTSWIILRRSPDFVPWLRWVVVAAAILATVALLGGAVQRWLPTRIAGGRLRHGLALGALGAIAVAAFAGPAAYAAETIRTTHAGGIVSAGPRTAPGAGPMFGPGERGRPPGGLPPIAGYASAGRLLNAGKPSARVAGMLRQNSARYTWVGAAVGANSAAGFQLATELPVMPIGGFNGSDPAPTLEQFQQYVADGKIHYFIGSGTTGRESASRSGAAGHITDWVRQHFRAVEVDGVTLYDLTVPLQ